MRRKGIFIRKPINRHANDVEGEHHLKRHLKSLHLVAIGIGAIIGAGIFVITGQAAAEYAGPAIVISFICAAVVCILAGLCYAELSALIPISGGSYSYSYVSMGEFPAWIVGWALTGQYLLSVSTVAVGWSGYFSSLLKDFGITLSDLYSHAPWDYNPATGWSASGAIINVPAMALIIFLGLLISIGIKAAAHFNNFMVVIKLSTIILFIFMGIRYIHTENWTPFIPPNTGVFGEFGWSGILRASGMVFFAYIGFDTVSTLAQDSVNPQKDLPRGILGSLIICTVAYIVTSLILTGIASYKDLNVPDPMSVALNLMNIFWFSFIVKIAILAGLASVVLVQMLGQTRIFFAISKDGLLPERVGRINRTFKTPVAATFIVMLVGVLLSGFFPVDVLGQLVSMTTLLIFAIVCLGVLILRYTHPEVKRPFKVPFVPVIPLLGIIICVAQMGFLPMITWVQLVCWLILGLIIYFIYSKRNSKLRHELKEHPEKVSETLY